MPLTAQFFQFIVNNAVFSQLHIINATIMPLKRCKNRHFCAWLPLSLQYSRLNAVKVTVFSGSTPLAPLFFDLNDVYAVFFLLGQINAAIFQIKHREQRYFSSETI